MKKILVAITIVAMLSITSSAMATKIKAAKAPKSACLSLGGNVGLSMAIKKAGALPFGTGKFTLYAIQGTLEESSSLFPCVGTGYMNGQTFVFTVTTVTDYAQFSMTGYWNVVFDTGYVEVVRSEEDFGVYEFSESLWSYDCGTIGVVDAISDAAMTNSEMSMDDNPFVEK